MLVEGTVLQGRYRIGKVLGRGGMGMVYRARDGNLECDVAVKQAFFDDDHLRKAFEREAKLLRKLTHANLPKVTDLFTEGDVQYLVMDFIAGKDLHALLEESGGRIALAPALGWADQILDALEYLHGQEPPVIHRDIKPANLKLTEKGKLYVLDFGLAKGFHTQASRMPAAGSVAGYTPGYAPIEQMQNAGTDARSDIYAVGATLYHLLTGTPPPDAMVRSMNLLGRQPDPLRPAHEVNPQVPRPISAALERATAMYCDGRPATAAEMRRELREAVATHERQVKTKPAPPPVAPVVAPPPTESKTGRLKQVNELLQTAYAKLAEFEKELVITADPGRRFEMRERMKEIHEEIAGYERERTQLAPSSTPPPAEPPVAPPTIQQVLAPPVAPVVRALELPKTFKNEIGMEFVLIPPGEFWMGSEKNDNEKPVHKVTIGYSFYMGKCQVTQHEWKVVMGDNPSWFKGDDRRPVEKVSWNDCQDFIRRLNDKNDGWKYRLPSEAEWEYACRAGTTGDYAGDLDAMAWYEKNSGGKTHLVGEKKANGWGLHDMHGNVWEWCQDRWHENYNGAPTAGSVWEQGSDNRRMLRGGSWYHFALNCRSASRNYYPPDDRYHSFGCRLVAARVL